VRLHCCSSGIKCVSVIIAKLSNALYRKTIDHLLGAELRKKLQHEGVIVPSNYEKDGESSGEEMLKSTLRVSNLYMPRHGSRHPKLQNPYYYHSAFPTTASDAIFLG